MPIGVGITLWVLFRKIKSTSFRYYVVLAFSWTLIAIICDYLFLVKVFNPAGSYYKPNVYLYYAFTFILPFVVGRRKKN